MMIKKVYEDTNLLKIPVEIVRQILKNRKINDMD